MKYKSIYGASVIALVTSFSVNAMDKSWWESPYIGVDAEVRRMDFKGGFGDNILQHHSPQSNIYAGLKFNDYVGIEAGYEATTTRTRTATLTTCDFAAGTPIPVGMSPIIFKSKLKIKGPHVDLVGFYTIDQRYPLQVLGAIGVSFVKGTVERRTLQAAGVTMSMNRTLSENRALLRLTAGLEYMFGEHLGARGTIGWVNTGKIVIYANDNVQSIYVPEIKPKDSTIYGLGILWRF